MYHWVIFIFRYDASDIDELTFNEGDIMVLVQEGKSIYIYLGSFIFMK